FSPREVLARVRAVLRRARGEPAQIEQLQVGELHIDRGRHEVRCHGRPVALTPTEFDLLLTLAQDPGRVYTRLQLLDRVQGMAYEGYERTIDAHVKIRWLVSNPRHAVTPCPVLSATRPASSAQKSAA
ncbi:MAG: winged helix-turn-helix transcriptional regulator, partial [Candidatus Rokubacteria bacterium]|nr:winged helix-turn-helix transcriptional regulator [Candidatus Rokubacteria bacterium]